jgi:hypothetical protein
LCGIGEATRIKDFAAFLLCPFTREAGDADDFGPLGSHVEKWPAAVT